MGFNRIYPLVNVYITMERSTMILMGKSTISTGPFSIPMLVYQRVYSINVCVCTQQDDMALIGRMDGANDIRGT